MSFPWTSASAEQRAAYIVERLDRECVEQSVPRKVTDPSTLARIGSLFRIGRQRAQEEAA